MSHPLKCACGRLQGYLDAPKRGLRAVCYCRDCRAFAHFLDQSALLNAQGGSDIIPAAPANVHFTKGLTELACIRLTERGLLRWYAKCCNTPIGNTPADARVPYIGLSCACLGGDSAVTPVFGPVRIVSFPQSALGKVRSRPLALTFAIARLLGMFTVQLIKRSQRKSPFLRPGTSAPVVEPRILTPQERQLLLTRVDA